MSKFALLPTNFSEVKCIVPKVFEDDRGFFTESYNEREFTEIGIADRFVQDNHSHSKKGVLRGLHFQLTPYPTSKLVRCVAGEIFDVIVDLRPSSPTFRKWEGFTLSSDNNHMLYIPVGFGHGFHVLSEAAEVTYKVNEYFHKEQDAGVRWNDPDIAVMWGMTDPILSGKDSNLPFLRDIKEKLIW